MDIYPTHKYFETINEFVSKLNFKWFSDKEVKFKKEYYYKQDKKKIYHIDRDASPDQ